MREGGKEQMLDLASATIHCFYEVLFLLKRRVAIYTSNKQIFGLLGRKKLLFTISSPFANSLWHF